MSTPPTDPALKALSTEPNEQVSEESATSVANPVVSKPDALDLEQLLDQEINSLDSSTTLPSNLVSQEHIAQAVEEKEARDAKAKQQSLQDAEDSSPQPLELESIPTEPGGNPFPIFDKEQLSATPVPFTTLSLGSPLPAEPPINELTQRERDILRLAPQTPQPHTLDAPMMGREVEYPTAPQGTSVHVKERPPHIIHTLSPDAPEGYSSSDLLNPPNFSGEVSETCQELPTIQSRLRNEPKNTDPELESAPNWKALNSIDENFVHEASEKMAQAAKGEEVLFSGSFEDLAQVSAKAAFHSFRPLLTASPDRTLETLNVQQKHLEELDSWPNEVDNGISHHPQQLLTDIKPVSIPVIASTPRLSTTLQMDLDPNHPSNHMDAHGDSSPPEPKENNLEFHHDTESVGATTATELSLSPTPSSDTLQKTQKTKPKTGLPPLAFEAQEVSAPTTPPPWSHNPSAPRVVLKAPPSKELTPPLLKKRQEEEETRNPVLFLLVVTLFSVIAISIWLLAALR